MIVTDCHSGNSCLDALPRMCQPDLPWPGTTPILLLHSVLISWQSLVVLTVFEAIVKSYPSKLRSPKDDHNQCGSVGVDAYCEIVGVEDLTATNY